MRWRRSDESWYLATSTVVVYTIGVMTNDLRSTSMIQRWFSSKCSLAQTMSRAVLSVCYDSDFPPLAGKLPLSAFFRLRQSAISLVPLNIGQGSLHSALPAHGRARLSLLQPTKQRALSECHEYSH